MFMTGNTVISQHWAIHLLSTEPIKPIFHQKVRSRWPTKANEMDRQYEIYMANANPTVAYKTQTIFQHLGMGNAKLSRWGCKPTRERNAKVFAFWWNIGCKLENAS